MIYLKAITENIIPKTKEIQKAKGDHIKSKLSNKFQSPLKTKTEATKRTISANNNFFFILFLLKIHFIVFLL